MPDLQKTGTVPSRAAGKRGQSQASEARRDCPRFPTEDEAVRYLDELFDALALGLRDYFEKVGAFERFLVAVSGGRDSALSLLVAVQAAKALNEGKEADRYAERVATVYLPNKGLSSSATEDAAGSLAKELGVPFKIVSIADEAEVALAKAAEMMDGEDKVTPLARQNLQARVRGNMLLNWANSANGLLLVLHYHGRRQSGRLFPHREPTQDPRDSPRRAPRGAGRHPIT